MTVTLHVPSVRSLALIFAGVLLGTLLVAPVFARGTMTPGAIEAAATTYTRTASCAGLNFHPIDDQTGFQHDGRLLFRNIGSIGDIYHPSGDGYFLCDPHLPDKAVVTRVRFTLDDSSDTRELRYCALYRAGLGTATARTSLDDLAQVQATGIPDMPGIVRLVDSSIAYATIDNTKWTYYLQCQIRSTGPGAEPGMWDAGIYGADVTYTITTPIS